MQDLKIKLGGGMKKKMEVLFVGEETESIINELKYYIRAHEQIGIKFTYNDMELNFDNAVGFVIKKEMKNNWQIKDAYVRR